MLTGSLDKLHEKFARQVLQSLNLPLTMRPAVICSLCLYILANASCLNDKADEVSGPCDSSYFVSSIRPIFMTHCYDPDNNNGCHNGSIPAQGDFSVYSAVQNGVEAHLPRMKDYINRPLTDPLHMPQGRELPAAELNTLNAWLDGGGKLCN